MTTLIISIIFGLVEDRKTGLNVFLALIVFQFVMGLI